MCKNAKFVPFSRIKNYDFTRLPKQNSNIFDKNTHFCHFLLPNPQILLKQLYTSETPDITYVYNRQKHPYCKNTHKVQKDLSINLRILHLHSSEKHIIFAIENEQIKNRKEK